MDERTNALPVGTELEGYRVVALLGAGGFGITYKAVDLLLDRHVAIKEYLPSVLANRSSDRKTVKAFGRQEAEQFVWGLERFRTEAKTLVAFQHHNIVPVHRYFESNGTGYLVMAFQDGKSLADVIDAVGTLSEDELLIILRPLAAGLADVHAKGFLHRDIKPANIIIRRDGTPVLIDFGAARQAVTRQSRGLTAIVTEGYAPYEQYETDSHQGPWTDIYALGAVLYHCVTGSRPPESPKRIAAQLRKQPDPMVPAARTAAGDYSESLLDAIDRALAVEEAKRPQSVRDFMAAVDGRGPAAAPPAAPPALSGGEAFVVDPPSQPIGRGTRTSPPPAAAAPAEQPAAEVAGNFMVEAPSQPVGRRAAPVPAMPPKEPLIARSRRSDRAPPPAPASDTLMAGGATLIVGGEDRAAGNAGVAVKATQPPVRGLRRRVGAPAEQKRSRTPLMVGVVLVLLAGGGAVGYFAQKGGAPSIVTPAPERPNTDSASTTARPPAPAPPPDEALARSKAAAPEQIWQHTETKTAQDVVRRIFALPNDQLLIAGGRIEAEGANSDVWLWRFDAKTGKPAGERKSIANTRFDTGNAIVLRPDGGVAMAAARRNLGTNSIVAWVARASAEGELQWQHTFQEHALTIPYALTLLANGDMVVVGSATEQGKNGLKGWAARIAADGRVLWNKTFGKGIDESLQSVALLPDGGIIAVGWTNVERAAGDDRNLWVLNLDGEGGVRWEKKDLGDEADEKGKAVLVAEGGDIVVLAEVSRAPAAPQRATAPRPAPRPGAAPPAAETEPVNKPWLLRLAPDGAIRWDKRYSGGKDDRNDSLDSIAPAGDGGFIMSGSTEGKGAGRKDGWLVRIDAEGAQLWDQQYGDQFDDEFTALTALPDRGVLIGGSTALKLETPPPAPPRGGRPPAKPEPPVEAKLWLLRLGYR